MKHLIAANWKMNPQTMAEAKRLFNSVKEGIKNIKNVEIVICPPFVYLSSFKFQVPGFRLGAQDCFWENPPTGEGAFTGEISPAMLRNLAVKYAIIGHSERRKYQKETDEMVNKKIKTALKNDLKPVLCIENVSQVKRGLEGISKEGLKNMVIAYEPVFAIGTGKPCSPEKAEKVRKAIKSATNADIPILYGGSVNSQNAGSYIEKAGFQGLLVGGASLNPEEFIKIVKNVSRA